MKKLLKAFILIFCCVMLCGCASVEYQRVTDDMGQIRDKFTIELEGTKIVGRIGQHEYDALKADIEHDLENYISTIQGICTSLQRELGGQVDFSEGVQAVASEWYSTGNGNEQIFVQVNYLNSSYYKLVNGITDDDEEQTADGNQIVSNWFVSKYIIKANNTFSNIEDLEGERNFYDYYTSTYGEYTIEDVNLVQIYGTTDKRLKSNADYVEKIDGVNYHLWEIDTKNGAYKTCELSYYYLTAVGTGWYVLALSLAGALAVTLIVIWLVKSAKNKKYKKTVVTNIEADASDED